MPLLLLETISYAYPNKEKQVLQQVNLQLHSGEMLGLHGSNGSGKSTLLHIAAGLITPQAGSVTLCGIHCTSEAKFIEARKHLGYLLQNSDDMLFCPSILEDVAFGPYNMGYTAKEAQAIAWETLKELGMEQFADANGNSLSGGEKKMAALACILSMKPRLLFLDEPTNDLDPASREKLLQHLKMQNIASVVISHDLEFMQQLCTRFCTLDEGVIREGCQDSALGICLGKTQ